jgi:hypothetical protein
VLRILINLSLVTICLCQFGHDGETLLGSVLRRCLASTGYLCSKITSNLSSVKKITWMYLISNLFVAYNLWSSDNS